eukprot:scaffold7711_cov96-Isochrysis_galbana.AAC.1
MGAPHPTAAQHPPPHTTLLPSHTTSPHTTPSPASPTPTPLPTTPPPLRIPNRPPSGQPLCGGPPSLSATVPLTTVPLLHPPDPIPPPFPPSNFQLTPPPPTP